MEGYKVKEYGMPVKRYCQFMEISSNPELITAYRECHSREKAWKEILDGIRSVGILEMDMHIIDNKVLMIVETPLEFDWDSAMAKLATLPRQAEWEAYVAVLQGCDPNATSAEKWRLMERMFCVYPDL